MGRNYSKAIIPLLLLLNGACSFDPPDGELKNLGGDYYATYDSHSPNDGLKIVFSKDKELLTVLASNCIDIYQNRNQILFSKNEWGDDSTKAEYFVIDKESKEDVKKIDKVSFQKRISGLERTAFVK